MTYKGHASARGNDGPFSSIEERFNRTPDLSASERATLALLHQTFETGSKVWPPNSSTQTPPQTTPLRLPLHSLGTPPSTQSTIIHVPPRERHPPQRAPSAS